MLGGIFIVNSSIFWQKVPVEYDENYFFDIGTYKRIWCNWEGDKQ